MAEFYGLPKAAVTFYEELARNNEKTRFEAHKAAYQHDVIAPARQFVLAMVERLKLL